MTLEQITGYLPAWLQKALAWAHIVIAAVATLAAVVGVIWGFFVWVVGPIQPKTQTDIASLYEKMLEVQTNTKDIKNKLDELPRPYEFEQMRRQQQAEADRLTELANKVSALAASLSAWINAVPRTSPRSDKD